MADINDICKACGSSYITGDELADKCNQLRAEVERLSFESVSQRCARTHNQCCTICEDLDCCDNLTDTAKEWKRLRKIEEAAKNMFDYGIPGRALAPTESTIQRLRSALRGEGPEVKP